MTVSAIQPVQILRPSEESQRVKRLVGSWTPKSRLGFGVLRSLRYLPEELAAELIDSIQSTFVYESALSIIHFRKVDEHPDGSPVWVPEDYGVVSRKVVTDAGVAFLVDAFQNLTEVENFKYHAIGTGTNAEAAANTGLQTELTTQYNPDNTRATGTQTENGANVYRTVGLNTVDAGVAAINEHALMSQAATGGGTCWDRSMFSGSPVGLNSGDGLNTTYDGTFASGG